MKKKLIYLDRNENHYGPAPEVFKALHKRNFKKLTTYSRDFTRGVKSKLSEHLSHMLGIDEKQILLGYGAEDLLKQAVHCFLSSGECILIPQYSWWYYKVIADEVGGIKQIYPIVEEEFLFKYIPEKIIEAYHTHKPAMVLISSPNNPTGNSIPLDDLVYVLQNMPEAVVVLDEAYTLFANPDTSYLKMLVERFPNVMITRTFSKFYGLAGIRVGYALLGKQLSELNTFSARYLGYNRLSERLAIAALDSKDYYEDMRRKMMADSQMFFKELNELPGFKAYRSDTNFILCRIPEHFKKPMDEYLKKKGFVIKFMNEDELNSHMRITLGTQEENRELMDAIKNFVKKHQNGELV
ncbi:MAG: pyridoxal phosphate-dependent aminotransferase [Bacteroidales bacterium]